MEIIETTEDRVNATGTPKESKNEGGESGTTAYTPLSDVKTVEKDSAKKTDSLVESSSSVVEDMKSLVDTDKDTVEITDLNKLEFINAVTSGDRYKEVYRLFGGNVVVKFRSRSLEETEAILAYMHKAGMTGKFSTRADVSNASLLALLVAQVEELNGVSYSEMKKPLKYTETSTGIEEPGWLGDLDVWAKKPEAVTAAIGDALVEFESKYWKMVGASRSENFWNPGGSTGK